MKCKGLIILPLLIISASNLWAQAKPVIEYRYYQVPVINVENIETQTKARRPANLTGDKDSHTDWRIDYTFNSVRKYGNNCQVNAYEINSSCTITLPQYQSSDAIVAVRLKSYEELLRIHELKHCEIVADHVSQFDNWIDSIRYYNCGQIMNSIRHQYEIFLAECARAQRSYDQMTNYGRREGADLTLLLPVAKPDKKPDSSQSLADEEAFSVEAPENASAPREPMTNYYRDENGVWRNDGGQ